PTDNDVVTLLNIGASTMNVNIVKGTRSLFTRDITVGGSQFTDVLQRSLGLNFQQAEAVKRGVNDAVDGIEEKAIEPLMNNVTEIVAMEIQKTFDFYRATTEDNETVVQKILISGGGSKLAGLSQELSQRLELPVEVLNPFRNIRVDDKKFDPEYLSEIVPEMAVAVGLAIRGV
ncbi:MAG: pilus assembly protein PilM, partial [Pyrinomonadaceae bacterium]